MGISRIAGQLQDVISDVEKSEGMDKFDLEELANKLDDIKGELERVAKLFERAWQEL